MPLSLSIPVINAQAGDAEMKKAEFNSNGSTACRLSAAAHSGDNKKVAMSILRTSASRLFSTQKTDHQSIKNWTS